ncbi:DedA family protein [Antribacter gilvus]|uniref:DedA family protein n=1 Tax=Antribacter gilvus TaxID=2304675 RepID=UPI000F7A8834|nr:DedA family protein [Antribacter gilvus]
MLEPLTVFLGSIESWILALAASPWVYPAMFGFATIDGFFPPLPSESVVITLTVTAHTTGTPILPLVLLMAAAGAWVGDIIAYHIGRAIGTERVPFLRGPRGRKAVAWAERALSRRAASFILAARYIPIGRVAVNMTAGAVGFPRRRFVGIAAVAAVMWAIYSMLIGLVAAEWLGHENTLLAIVFGVVLGVSLGFVVDKVVMRLSRRQGTPDGDQPEADQRDAQDTPDAEDQAEAAVGTPDAAAGTPDAAAGTSDAAAGARVPVPTRGDGPASGTSGGDLAAG